MDDEKQGILRIHAGCCNSRELGQLLGHYTPQSRAILDGRLVGEGPDGIHRALVREFDDNIVTRVQVLDGEPVLVEYDGEAAARPKAVLRLESRGGRVMEVRIDHDAASFARLERAR